jgi:hypothetical protein
MIEPTKVKASAMVEMLKFGAPPTWDVSVWGEEPHSHRRNYTLRAKTDNDAAFEGIRLFVEEMETLDSVKGED